MIDFLDLAEQYTTLKRAAAGELSGPCPGCGGSDRFRVWPDRGRYFCRSCGAKGDAVQFCRDFLGLSFADACRAIGQGHRLNPAGTNRDKRQNVPLVPLPQRPKRQAEKQAISDPAGPDRDRWQQQAARFAEYAHAELMRRPDLLEWLEADRGLCRSTVEAWGLGFNPAGQRSRPGLWGFAGDDKSVYLAAGLVIPHRQQGGTVTGLNVRRFKPGDALPEQYRPTDTPDPPYLRVRGTKSRPWALSDGPFSARWPAVLVESELDALLLWQALGLFAVPVALLSASARPGPLPGLQGPLLWALDADGPGQAGYAAWAAALPGQVHKAPPIRGKDITDMYRAGVSLPAWFKTALQRRGLLSPDVLNPFAHFTLTCGPDWSRPPGMSAELWTACRDIEAGPVVRWQLNYCWNREQARQAEAEYKALWAAHA